MGSGAFQLAVSDSLLVVQKKPWHQPAPPVNQVAKSGWWVELPKQMKECGWIKWTQWHLFHHYYYQLVPSSGQAFVRIWVDLSHGIQYIPVCCETKLETARENTRSNTLLLQYKNATDIRFPCIHLVALTVTLTWYAFVQFKPRIVENCFPVGYEHPLHLNL